MSQQQFFTGGGAGPGGADLHVARYIASPGGGPNGANYTTLNAAYAAAVAAGGNQTVFLQPGTYNIGTLVLSPNVGISAFDCDGVIPNVIVNGKMTANITGICAFSGIYFVNNSDNILAVTGSGSSQIRFIDCWVQVGGTAFAITNSNNSCAVSFETCQGDITGTSAYFNFTGGAVNVNNSFFFNGQLSTTQNSFAGASIGIQSSVFNSPILNNGLGGVSLLNTSMICLNDTCITTGGATNSDLVVYNSHIDSNNATAIVIGAGGTMTLANTSVGSSATDAISGAGTLRYSPISFTKTSASVNVGAQQPIRFGPSISPIMPDTNGVVYYDGTIITTVDPDTAGYVLTSNGAGSAPTMQPSSSGGNVVGPSPSTDRAIATYDGVLGNALFDNPGAQIDSAGIMTNVDQPGFIAYLGANSALLTGDGTIAIVPFDQVIVNRTSSYNTATNTFTLPKDGLYQFNYSQFMFFTTGTVDIAILGFRVNGATIIRNYEVNLANLNVLGECILTSSLQYYGVVGDTIEITCQVTGNGSPNVGFGGGINAGTRFSGSLIG